MQHTEPKTQTNKKQLDEQHKFYSTFLQSVVTFVGNELNNLFEGSSTANKVCYYMNCVCVCQIPGLVP